MFFLIDGYNLLHSIQKTSEDSEPITDVNLCLTISRFLSSTGQKGEIIFDGIGPPDKTGFDNIRDLEVIFSGKSLDADTVIEDKIAADTAPKRLIIVSSDRRLRNAARLRKAVSLKADSFWLNVCRQLNKKKKIKEPPEKRRGLSAGETEQWLKFFDLEQ